MSALFSIAEMNFNEIVGSFVHEQETSIDTYCVCWLGDYVEKMRTDSFLGNCLKIFSWAFRTRRTSTIRNGISLRSQRLLDEIWVAAFTEVDSQKIERFNCEICNNLRFYRNNDASNKQNDYWPKDLQRYISEFCIKYFFSLDPITHLFILCLWTPS